MDGLIDNYNCNYNYDNNYNYTTTTNTRANLLHYSTLITLHYTSYTTLR